MTEEFTPQRISELLTQCVQGKGDAEIIAKQLSKLHFDNEIVNSAIHYLHHFYADIDLRSKDQEYDKYMKEKLLSYAIQLKNL